MIGKLGIGSKQVVFDDSALNAYKAETAMHVPLSIVTPEYFGAIGNANYFKALDGKWYADAGFTTESHDDTTSFQDAIDYLVANGGGTVLGDKCYLIDSIEVKAGVKVKFVDFRRPYLTITTTDFSTYTIGLCRADDSTGNGVVVKRWGSLENVMVLGGNKTVANYGIYLEPESFAQNIYVSHGYHGIYVNDVNVDGLFAIGNIADGVAFTGADLWCRRSLMASNGGNGMVLDTLSTITFTQGKTEWNKQHNVKTENYCQEINFNDFIIDAANWFNIYCLNSAFVLRFNDVQFIGGRFAPDSELLGTEMETNTDKYCMIFSETSNFQASFSNCFFRYNNISTGVTENDKLISILGFKNDLSVKTKVISFANCINPKLKICSYDTGSVANIMHDNTVSDGEIDASQKYYYYNDGNTVKPYMLSSATIQGLDTTKLKSGTMYYDYTILKMVFYTSTGWRLTDGTLAYDTTPKYKTNLDVKSSAEIQALTEVSTGVMIYDYTLYKPVIKTTAGWRLVDGTMAY